MLYAALTCCRNDHISTVADKTNFSNVTSARYVAGILFLIANRTAQYIPLRTLRRYLILFYTFSTAPRYTPQNITLTRK